MSKALSSMRHPGARGFTLIEIMIAVAVIAILAALLLPSFVESVRKGRRTDAFTAIANVQQMQERWRGVRSAYAGDAVLAEPWAPADAASAPGLGIPRLSAKGYYSLALSGTGAAGYTVTATAVTGTSQASDGPCKVLAAQLTGGNLSYGAGVSVDAIDWTDPKRCWAR